MDRESQTILSGSFLYIVNGVCCFFLFPKTLQLDDLNVYPPRYEASSESTRNFLAGSLCTKVSPEEEEYAFSSGISLARAALHHKKGIYPKIPKIGYWISDLSKVIQKHPKKPMCAITPAGIMSTSGQILYPFSLNQYQCIEHLSTANECIPRFYLEVVWI